MGKNAKKVLVTGDIIKERNIYRGTRRTPDAPEGQGTRESTTREGAARLHRILETLARQMTVADNQADEATVALGFEQNIYRKLPERLQGHSVWEPTPAEPGSRDKTWRMTRHLGYGTPGRKHVSYEGCLCDAVNQAPDILAIEDAGFGYRFKSAAGAWPSCIKTPGSQKPRWVVVNMSGQLTRGDLWRDLSRNLSSKLLLIVSIEDVRSEATRITSGISWERTALDLLKELKTNRALGELRNCRHLVVNFGAAGAVHIDRPGSTKSGGVLIFDPANMEGEWRGRLVGTVLGDRDCLAAGVIRELMRPGQKPDIPSGIIAGLAAMRRLLLNGHGNAGDIPGFPHAAVADEILSPAWHYSRARLPDLKNVGTPVLSDWSIIATTASGGRSAHHPLFGVARRVALSGPSALRELPYARFGKLFTTDRMEIESLRNIQLLISQYRRAADGKKPLSLAVFGPPGAGKSFSIEQIAANIMGQKPATLEFNLSQFSGTADLIGAFHQVRDKVLEGRIPLVFWDEFDSKNYQWLQYLLAPMQDGKFQEGQITHPIGKCVFVFAGGTSYRMENFGPSINDSEKYVQFKLLKGPDFVSRLHGYLNVLGPNRRQTCETDDRPGAEVWTDDPSDICFPIRRALLLRVVLGLKDGQRLHIDSGLLTALLEVDRYRHGARSLQTILTQLKQDGRTEIRRSDLPAEKTLSLHIDAREFIALIDCDVQFMMKADDLAPSIHWHFLKNADKRGSYIKFRKAYEKLPENIKQANTDAAARIPQVLDLVGLYVAPKNATGPDGASDGEILAIIEENIDLLAETEHELWCEERRANGWRYGKKRNDEDRIHTSLVPFEQLSEADKNKDRDQVRSYPEIVRIADYKIVTSVKWH